MTGDVGSTPHSYASRLCAFGLPRPSRPGSTVKNTAAATRDAEVDRDGAVGSHGL